MWAVLREALRYGYFHPRFIANREIARFIREHACEFSGDLLDVGCGKEPYRRFFTGIQNYVGVDVPFSMHGTSCLDIAGSVLALPFADRSFDAILCSEVLEHTQDPVWALREMARVVRAGGRLLLTVPLSEQLHEEPHDFCRFTQHWIHHLFAESGWRVVEIRPRGGAWLELGYRLSSLLYCSFGASRGLDGGLQPRLLLGPVIVVLCAIVQMWAVLLDRFLPNSLSTIGWCVIGEQIAS